MLLRCMRGAALIALSVLFTGEAGAAPEEHPGARLVRENNCIACHGMDAISGGIVPDLRRTTSEVHATFADIVIGGLRAPLGMPSFDDRLDADDVRQIQAYVLQRARESVGSN